MSETSAHDPVQTVPRDLRSGPPAPTRATCPPPPALSALPTRPVRTAPAGPAPRFRNRIEAGPSGGFYPAPHRYHLYLSLGCPLSLRLAITLDLLGLRESVTSTLIALPDASPEALAPLRTAYEATRHHYSGPLTVPVLCDRWSGRVVSNHTPDILRDLATRFDGVRGTRLPGLRPPALAADIDTLTEFLDEDITEVAQRAGAAPASRRQGEAAQTLLAALELLDRQLESGPYLLGDALTAADVDLWVALVYLDAVHRLHLDAGTVHRIAAYDRLWAYVRRLHRLPAFHGNLRPDRMAWLHRRTCRGPETSGAAVTLPGVLGGGAG